MCNTLPSFEFTNHNCSSLVVSNRQTLSPFMYMYMYIHVLFVSWFLQCMGFVPREGCMYILPPPSPSVTCLPHIYLPYMMFLTRTSMVSCSMYMYMYMYMYMLQGTGKSKARYTPRTAFLFFQRKDCPGWDSNSQHSIY